MVAQNGGVYELSSQGDRRGSALYARLPDGRTIEDAYQQAKGYRTWREGKGKPALTPGFDYQGTYDDLWRQYLTANPDFLRELAGLRAQGVRFNDRFSQPGRVNQADTLARLADEYLQQQQQAPAFRIVPSRGQYDVLGMRQNGRNMATVSAPFEPGWLGNPYVADDAGGRYSREEATRLFGELVEERARDPAWAEAFRSLAGKSVGYYKPDEPFIHLQALQNWLARDQGVPAAPTPSPSTGTPSMSIRNQTLTNVPVTALSDAELGQLFLELADRQIDALNQSRASLRERYQQEDLASGKQPRTIEELDRQGLLPKPRGWLSNLVAPRGSVPAYREDPEYAGMDYVYRYNPRQQQTGMPDYSNAIVEWVDSTGRAQGGLLFQGDPRRLDSINYESIGGLARRLLDPSQDATGRVIRNPFTQAAMTRNQALENDLWTLQQTLREEQRDGRALGGVSSLGLPPLSNPQPVVSSVSPNQITGLYTDGVAKGNDVTPILKAIDSINRAVTPTVGQLGLQSLNANEYALGVPQFNSAPPFQVDRDLIPENLYRRGLKDFNPNLPFGTPQRPSAKKGEWDPTINQISYQGKTGDLYAFKGADLFYGDNGTGGYNRNTFTPTTEPNAVITEPGWFVGRVGIAGSDLTGQLSQFRNTPASLSLTYNRPSGVVPFTLGVTRSTWNTNSEDPIRSYMDGSGIYSDAVGGGSDKARFARLQDELSVSDVAGMKYMAVPNAEGLIYSQPLNTGYVPARVKGADYQRVIPYSPRDPISWIDANEEAAPGIRADSPFQGLKGEIARDLDASGRVPSQAYRQEYVELPTGEGGFAIDPQPIESRLQGQMNRERAEDLIRYYGMEDFTDRQTGKVDRELAREYVDGLLKSIQSQTEQLTRGTGEVDRSRLWADRQELERVQGYLDDTDTKFVGSKDVTDLALREAKALVGDDLSSLSPAAARVIGGVKPVAPAVKPIAEVNPFFDMGDILDSVYDRVLNNNVTPALPPDQYLRTTVYEPVKGPGSVWIESPETFNEYAKAIGARQTDPVMGEALQARLAGMVRGDLQMVPNRRSVTTSTIYGDIVPEAPQISGQWTIGDDQVRKLASKYNVDPIALQDRLDARALQVRDDVIQRIAERRGADPVALRSRLDQLAQQSEALPYSTPLDYERGAEQRTVIPGRRALAQEVFYPKWDDVLNLVTAPKTGTASGLTAMDDFLEEPQKESFYNARINDIVEYDTRRTADLMERSNPVPAGSEEAAAILQRVRQRINPNQYRRV